MSDFVSTIFLLVIFELPYCCGPEIKTEVAWDSLRPSSVQIAPVELHSVVSGSVIMPTSAYLKAQRLRRQFRADFSEMVDKVDVVMTPSMPAPAPRDLNTTGDAAFQVPWTTAGLPTVVVSTGLSELGMPMAVQFGGPWAQEGRVLGAAQWCERIAGLKEALPNH